MSLALMLGTMLGLAALGVPLVFALLAGSLVTLLIMRPGLPLEVIPQLFVQGMDNFALLAIALFFLAGELMSSGGVTGRILAFSRALVGHFRGGLAQVGTWIAIAFFGVVRFLTYIDQRIRLEGWEVELRLRAAGAALEDPERW